MTLAEAAAEAARRLHTAGIAPDDSRRDATLLARAILQCDEAAWIAHNRDSATADFTTRFDALIARRERREPVAYILGEREFYGRRFTVTPAVLIPRPETELIAEHALRHVDDVPAGIVDVGTGSGCLAVTLAIERPWARVIATDTSADALSVARTNAERHGVADQIEFLGTNLLGGLTEPVDLIVSNPPYVPERDRASLAADVLDYEPSTALFAGDDGLDVIRALVPAAAGLLRRGGSLIMEFGAGQADAVRRIVEATRGLEIQSVVNDLQQIPRVVIAERTMA